MLFDVDLTLVNTGGAGIRALDRVFEEMFAIRNVTEGITPHGKTDPAIIREIYCNASLTDVVDSAQAVLSKDLLDRLLQRYVFYLDEEVTNSEQYRILPGIADILKEMSHRPDTATGLATGNVEVGARIKLERGGLNEFFPFGGFGSDSEDRVALVRKAGRLAAEVHQISIEPEDTFVIGDTPRDVLAGRAAGFRTVAVATGRFNIEALEMTNADLVIADFESDHDQFLRFTRML